MHSNELFGFISPHPNKDNRAYFEIVGRGVNTGIVGHGTSQQRKKHSLLGN